MSKEVTRYDLRVTNDGAGLYATDEPNTRGMQYVSALDYEALLAEREALRDALNQIADYPDHDTLELKRIARAALQGAQP